MSDYGPSFAAAKLYRKKSAKGTTYFVGRMGGVKVALVKSRETAENGDEIWSLMFSEAQQKPKDKAPQTDHQRPPDDAPRATQERTGQPDSEIPY